VNKCFAPLLILILTVSSLIVVTAPAFASIIKPSVPEFTVKLVDSSYDVPTTHSIDPYTGENVTHAGRHVESRTIEVKIKNQPFVPYYDTSSGWTINFYLNIRIKGHYSEDWRELFRASDGYPTQSDSDYTVISYQGEYSTTEGMDFTSQTIMTNFPSGGQVDFQVEAMIGYVHREVEGPIFAPWRFTDETSGWSNTQTLTIDTNSPQSPVISILSPTNTTHAAVYDPYITVPLTFATNTSLSWVGYSLDGGSNVTVTNGTLIEIPAESRSLTLYANDTAGNRATPQTVYYEIAFNLGYPPVEPFPTLLVVAVSVAVVAAVGVGVLVYFKKRKRGAERS
jgi:hypothetical protein